MPCHAILYIESDAKRGQQAEERKGRCKRDTSYEALPPVISLAYTVRYARTPGGSSMITSTSCTGRLLQPLAHKRYEDGPLLSVAVELARFTRYAATIIP